MAIRYAPEERAALDARARAMLAEYPDVGSFIRRGLGRNSSGEAIVYLRTALDPAPAVTSADAFRGLLGSASRWLRRNGVGPRDVVSLLAPELHRDVGRLLGGDEFGRRAATQSALHPRGDRRASRRSRGQNSVCAAARRARRPVREDRGAAGAGAPPRAHRRAAARRNRRLRRRGDRSRRRCERAPESAEAAEPDRVVALLPTGGTTGAPKVVPLTNRNVVSSAIASMLAGEFRAVDRIMVVLPLFHVGGSFCASSRVWARARLWSFRPPGDFAIPRSSPTFGVSSRRSA